MDGRIDGASLVEDFFGDISVTPSGAPLQGVISPSQVVPELSSSATSRKSARPSCSGLIPLKQSRIDTIFSSCAKKLKSDNQDKENSGNAQQTHPVVAPAPASAQPMNIFTAMMAPRPGMMNVPAKSPAVKGRARVAKSQL